MIPWRLVFFVLLSTKSSLQNGPLHKLKKIHAKKKTQKTAQNAAEKHDPPFFSLLLATQGLETLLQLDCEPLAAWRCLISDVI